MALTAYDEIDGSVLVAQVKQPGRVVTESPGVFRLTCLKTDTEVAGSGTNMRAEIYVNKNHSGAVEGADQWWGFGIEGISGPTPEGAFGMRSQWHGPNGTGQPQVVTNTPGALLNTRLWDAGTNQQYNFAVVDAAGAALAWANGQVFWFVERIVHSTNPAVGLVERWCNGVKFCARALQTLYTVNTSGASVEIVNYPKWGIYTNDKSDDLVVRVHKPCRGASMAEVVSNFPAGTGFGDPAPPPSAPSVAFLSPADGATVGGRVDWYAEAANPGGSVSKVEFLVDGAPVLTEINPPYGDTVTHWDTTAHADGLRTLTLRAYSDATTVVATATRSVSIDNTPEPPPPPAIEDPDPAYHKVIGAKSPGGKVARAKIAGGKR